MQKVATGSSLIAELESALTLLDIAEHGFVPQFKGTHISKARESCSLIRRCVETAALSDDERTVISIELSVLERRIHVPV
jgi:hypothetical protein